MMCVAAVTSDEEMGCDGYVQTVRVNTSSSGGPITTRLSRRKTLACFTTMNSFITKHFLVNLVARLNLSEAWSDNWSLIIPCTQF